MLVGRDRDVAIVAPDAEPAGDRRPLLSGRVIRGWGLHLAGWWRGDAVLEPTACGGCASRPWPLPRSTAMAYCPAHLPVAFLEPFQHLAGSASCSPCGSGLRGAPGPPPRSAPGTVPRLGWLRSGGQLRVRQRVATPKRAAPWWRRGPGEVKATSSSSSPLFAFSSAVSK